MLTPRGPHFHPLRSTISRLRDTRLSKIGNATSDRPWTQYTLNTLKAQILPQFALRWLHFEIIAVLGFCFPFMTQWWKWNLNLKKRKKETIVKINSSLNLMQGFLSNLGSWFPWSYARTFFSFFFFFVLLFFFTFEQKGIYFSFLLTWDRMGAKISKRYSSSYKSQPKVFKLFLKFLPNGPHKTTFGILKYGKLKF